MGALPPAGSTANVAQVPFVPAFIERHDMVDVVDASGISEEWIEKEKKIEAQSEDLQGKPENIIEKIVTGRVDKSIKTKLLMAQPYIRDTDMSVEEMVKGYIAKLSENIKVA